MVKLTDCRQAFCLRCQPLIAQVVAWHLPLLCPAKNCARAIHVSDVYKLSRDTDALVHAAVLAYVKQLEDEYAVCPQPDCSQILPRIHAQADHERATTAQFTECESCQKIYCLSCSDATGQEKEVSRHVHIVRERILKLCCPQFQTIVADFGHSLAAKCLHAACSSPWFCKCCFAFSSPSVKTALSHVQLCTNNPEPGQHAISINQILTILHDRRQRQLRQYLETHIACDQTRRVVAERGACLDGS